MRTSLPWPPELQPPPSSGSNPTSSLTSPRMKSDTLPSAMRSSSKGPLLHSPRRTFSHQPLQRSPNLRPLGEHQAVVAAGGFGDRQHLPSLVGNVRSQPPISHHPAPAVPARHRIAVHGERVPIHQLLERGEAHVAGYALFRGGGEPVHDGALAYDNMFDASVDAFVWALEREGFGGVALVVAETGWPTAGGEAASVANALAFNGNVARRAASDAGTPKRPGVGVEVYLFGLFDENEKVGEEYERHFGIFGLNGAKAYNLTFN
ncbi:uncharacterized protein LOC104431117 [Eucalyptus grandis]|uniref:uncharacterized protein LOC104431117 n=1 Tax=Eucalyptus grandis TaxID=71139 RepID=UPI00192F0DE9|nr:uncharacterized protein LOC104431117 [Eucalyptus grandis]